jgi:hypothetical protein
VGLGAVLEEEFMREKRDWSSERVLEPVVVVGEVVFWLGSFFHGLLPEAGCTAVS